MQTTIAPKYGQSYVNDMTGLKMQWVEHPVLREAKVFIEAYRYGNMWIAQDTLDSKRHWTAKTRKAVVALAIEAAEAILAEAASEPETLAQAIVRAARSMHDAEVAGEPTEALSETLVAEVMAAADRAGISQDIAFMDLTNELGSLFV